MRRNSWVCGALGIVLLTSAACATDVEGEEIPEQDRIESQTPPPVIAPPVNPPPPVTDPATGVAKPQLRRCVGRPFTPDPKMKWLEWESSLIALGRARHAAKDEIVTEGMPVTIRGKFAYGSVSKDLEDERVRLFIDDCTGWKKVADLITDDDGRTQRALGTLPLGVYEVRFEVMGDQSLAPATIWVVPRGTKVAVFDIDGTLTSGDGELIHEVFSDIFFDRYIPQAYPFARDLTLAHEGIGYIPVYVTGRPYWLSFHTRRWLREGGFALAPLRLTDSNSQALPTTSGVGAYKLAFLQQLQQSGLVIDFAYGNASTDIYAYLNAGIAAARTWIIGKHAGEQGTNGVIGSWEVRTAEVEALPPVDQPFIP